MGLGNGFLDWRGLGAIPADFGGDVDEVFEAGFYGGGDNISKVETAILIVIHKRIKGLSEVVDDALSAVFNVRGNRHKKAYKHSKGDNSYKLGSEEQKDIIESNSVE